MTNRSIYFLCFSHICIHVWCFSQCMFLFVCAYMYLCLCVFVLCFSFSFFFILIRFNLQGSYSYVHVPINTYIVSVSAYFFATIFYLLQLIHVNQQYLGIFSYFAYALTQLLQFKVALGVSPQFFSNWIQVLNHNKYLEIKQFSKEDIKQNNISTVILLIKFLVYQWDPRHLQGSQVVYIFIHTLYSCSI